MNMRNEKRKAAAKVLGNQEIAPGIYDMWLDTELAGAVRAGQFIGVYPRIRAPCFQGQSVSARRMSGSFGLSFGLQEEGPGNLLPIRKGTKWRFLGFSETDFR